MRRAKKPPKVAVPVVVLKPGVLRDLLESAGLRSVGALATRVQAVHGKPGRATVYNLAQFAGSYGVRLPQAENIADVLGVPVHIAFSHADGAQLRRNS